MQPCDIEKEHIIIYNEMAKVAIKKLFTRLLYKRPWFLFGFSFMLRTIWNNKTKIHIIPEDVKIKTMFFKNKRLSNGTERINKFLRRLVIKIINGVYKEIDSFSNRYEITNLVLYVDVEFNVLKPIIHVNIDLQSGV